MDSAMELSSNIMALPCEILVDILSRLSLKHVHQLQTVSKLCLKTISSTNFRRLYNMKSMTRPRVRVVQVRDSKYSLNWEMISRTIIMSTMDLDIDSTSRKSSVLRILLPLNTPSSYHPISSFSITRYAIPQQKRS